MCLSKFAFKTVVWTAFFLVASFRSEAAGPKVPAKLTFADVKLKITEDARRLIQKDVDALTRSERHFQILVDRADTYFPIIEQVFREEGIPDDFKYLALQESALKGDVVSSSNAVGYWQFKDFTALEVGMRIDKQVDERMHIIAASRGACKYLKKSNFYFNNWLYALQSYQQGAGATMDAVDSKLYGQKSITINKKTYWYVRKFLAHKIAFQNAVGKKTGGVHLSVYINGKGKSLGQIASELEVQESELELYNKWIRRNKIPNDDKGYQVLVPVKSLERVSLQEGLVNPVAKIKTTSITKNQQDRYPEVTDIKSVSNSNLLVTINGLAGIVAKPNEKAVDLSERGGAVLSKFLLYNDIEIDDEIIAGKVYYLKAKRGKARVYYHTVQPGEEVWGISQKYGIKLASLLKKNRLESGAELKTGRVLWLKKKRPASTAIEYKKVDIPKVVVVATQKPTEPKVKEEPTTVLKQEGEEKERTDEVPKTDSEPAKIDEATERNSVSVKEPIGRPVDQNNAATDANQKEVVHLVKKKESLYAISKMYQVNVMDILEWNNLKIEDGLAIGQELRIKISDTESENDKQEVKIENGNNSYIDHVVKKGETLYSIARQYDVTLKQLMEWNGKNEFNLTVGEHLKVRKD